MAVLQTLMTWIIKIIIGRERMNSRQDKSTGKQKRASCDTGSSIQWNTCKAKYCLKYKTIFLDFFLFFSLQYKKKTKPNSKKQKGVEVFTFVLDWTCSLQMRHFFTRGEHREHVAICPHGPNRVSLFISEHTMHSSKVSESLLIIDGLREPTWPL